LGVKQRRGVITALLEKKGKHLEVDAGKRQISSSWWKAYQLRESSRRRRERWRKAWGGKLDWWAFEKLAKVNG